MDISRISNSKELNSHLAYLVSAREAREAKIIDDAKSIIDALMHPAAVIKESARDLAGDKDFKTDLLKIGVNLASNYFTRKITTTAVNSFISTVLGRFSNKKDGGNSFGILNLISRIVPGKKKKINKTTINADHQ